MASVPHLPFFLINYFIILGAAIHSGLYIDNGLDQTVMHRSLSHRDRRHFEVELLDLLGLPERPRVARSTPVRSAGHKYLLDLYKSQLDASARSARSGYDIQEGDLSVIEESDAILSLKNLYHTDPNNTAVSRLHKLWFDVKSIPPSVDGIIRAELRVFQSSLASLPNDKTYALDVHQIKKEDNGGEKLVLVNSVNTSSGFEGWHSFNLTGPLTDWMLSGHNYGLYLRAYALDEPENLLDLNDLGVAKGAIYPGIDVEDEPFMIIFMHGETRRSRVRRQARHRKKKTENSETPNLNPLMDAPMAQRTQSARNCQIQSLFVNFSDLEWQDWIIAPVGYSAFYCSGECNFPLNAHMNATNHAIVQTLVNLINPMKVPRPCCAPTKLTPISVLYFVDDNNVILKKYKNMVVKSCGCH